jgi:hypothetical protein
MAAQPANVAPASPTAASGGAVGSTANQATDAAATDSLSVFYGSRRLEGISNMKAAAAMTILVMPQLGANLEELVTLSHNIMKNCLHGDALLALKRAGVRMRSLEQVGGRFLANGGDIVGEMSDAVERYEAKDLHGFGKDVGISLRKVLLSNSTDSSLPEGLPKSDVLANVTQGLIGGFFGRGVGMDVQLRGPESTFRMDLHGCMKKNSKFFKSVWASTMFLFAKEDATGGGESSITSRLKHHRAQVGTALALTLMQVPKALRQCGITPAQEAMMLDSIKALGHGSKFRLKTPVSVDQLNKDTVALGVAETVKSWSAQDWQTFGRDLGKLLQAMAAEVFPQKYSVDGAGRLQAQILADTSARGAVVTRVGGALHGAAGSSLAVVVGFGLLALLSLRFSRAVRRTSQSEYGASSDGAE